MDCLYKLVTTLQMKYLRSSLIPNRFQHGIPQCKSGRRVRWPGEVKAIRSKIRSIYGAIGFAGDYGMIKEWL